MRVFHYLSAEYALMALRNSRLKVALYENLNDPFELNAADLGDTHMRRSLKSFRDDWAKKNGLCCFSETWRSPLMWSHYADRHKGVALEFDLENEYALPVIYSPNKIPISLDEIKKRGGVTEEFSNRLMMTKYSGWKYEREIRICMPLNECIKADGLFFYSFGEELKLKRLIIGPLCNLRVSDVEKVLPTRHSLSVFKARLGFKTFSIVRDHLFGKDVLLQKK